jgi:NADP-dependent 3-hydroxy acid dehydrogenase YdfG
MSIQSVILSSYAEEDIAMAKVWLITGSGNGLGRDIAEAALAAGDSVVAGARRTEELTPLVAQYGERVKPITLEVRDEADDGNKQIAHGITQAVDHRGSRADRFDWAGGFKSRTMIVIITEKTPSENAVSRSVEVLLSIMILVLPSITHPAQDHTACFAARMMSTTFSGALSSGV